MIPGSADPRLRRARSAPRARGSRSPRRGRAPAACRRALRRRSARSWSAKQTSVLSPGGSCVSVVPSASSTVSRNVGGSRVARPLGPGDDELAPRQHRRQPDDVEPRDRAVLVCEDAAVHVRPRIRGIGAQAPAADVDRRLAEQVVDPVAGVHAVGDDRRDPLERTQPPRIRAGILIRVRGLVAERRLDQQRPPERSVRDQLAEPVDRGVMPVREADLEPVGRAGRRAHVRRLGDREPERLLREHPLAGVERAAHETCRGGGRGGDHDGVDLGIGQHGRDVRRSARALGRGCEALLLEVGDGHQRDALLAGERGEVGAHGDVAKADQRDPEGWLAHRADPNMRY